MMVATCVCVCTLCTVSSILCMVWARRMQHMQHGPKPGARAVPLACATDSGPKLGVEGRCSVSLAACSNVKRTIVSSRHGPLGSNPVPPCVCSPDVPLVLPSTCLGRATAAQSRHGPGSCRAATHPLCSVRTRGRRRRLRLWAAQGRTGGLRRRPAPGPGGCSACRWSQGNSHAPVPRWTGRCAWSTRRLPEGLEAAPASVSYPIDKHRQCVQSQWVNGP